MSDFDKDLFIAKIRNNGYDIEEDDDNIFILPWFIPRIPELSVTCMYDDERKHMSILANIAVSEKAMTKTVYAWCNMLNTFTRFYTSFEAGDIMAAMDIHLSKEEYVHDITSWASIFVALFNEEFSLYGVKAFQYASTGDLKYLE